MKGNQGEQRSMELQIAIYYLSWKTFDLQYDFVSSIYVHHDFCIYGKIIL